MTTAAADPRATMPPAAWLRRHAPLIAPGSRVLDLAAGHGRNARYLASLGHRVVAVDRDATVLAALDGVAGVTTRVLDLETPAWPLAGERFDAIVVNHYLHRPSFDAMLDALSDAGVLVYETFAAGNEAFGRPSNPSFLLAPGELLARTRGRLDVVSYEGGRVERGGGPAVIQRLAAVGPAYARPWRLAEARDTGTEW
jgi:SAM-dependent methyltransferase